MSNDSEKPNLEKDHKEFLKMKEQQINNKDEFVSDNDPIGKEMKKAGEKPSRESIKKGGAQEGFIGSKAFKKYFKKSSPKGKQRMDANSCFYRKFFCFWFCNLHKCNIPIIIKRF